MSLSHNNARLGPARLEPARLGPARQRRAGDIKNPKGMRVCSAYRCFFVYLMLIVPTRVKFLG